MAKKNNLAHFGLSLGIASLSGVPIVAVVKEDPCITNTQSAPKKALPKSAKGAKKK